MNAQLQIVVAKRDNATVLKKAFCTTPFKVANITEDRNANQLQLMIMSSSPGILDKDHYEIKIDLEKGSDLSLYSQAYQRLFQMNEGACQQLFVTLEEKAAFTYLPHPTVPHENSIFTSRNNYYLKNDCSLLIGEILTCGRKLNNEQFLFSKFHSITNVYLNNKLLIRENLLIQPSLINIYVIGQLEGYTHQASLIWIRNDIDIIQQRRKILNMLEKETDIMAGVSAAPVNGLVIRILGHGAEQLYNCLIAIREMIESQTVETPEYEH